MVSRLVFSAADILKCIGCHSVQMETFQVLSKNNKSSKQATEYNNKWYNKYMSNNKSTCQTLTWIGRLYYMLFVKADTWIQMIKVEISLKMKIWNVDSQLKFLLYFCYMWVIWVIYCWVRSLSEGWRNRTCLNIFPLIFFPCQGRWWSL